MTSQRIWRIWRNQVPDPGDHPFCADCDAYPSHLHQLSRHHKEAYFGLAPSPPMTSRLYKVNINT
jgi:hypothetical protein